MAVRLTRSGSGSRLQFGASVLAAARSIDTRPVKERLQRFAQAQRNYVNAQKKVDAAEAQLTVAQARIAELDAVQDDAVDALARALIHDGQPIGNAFAAFGAPTLGALKRLPFDEEAAAVHQLVAAVLRSKGVSEATTKAAQAADKAASVVEEALGPIGKLEDSVREARWTRDVVGQAWESTLAALRRMAQTVAAEGSPDLYARLFPPVTRTGTKTKPAEAPAGESSTSTPTPTEGSPAGGSASAATPNAA
jgi:hypothetical protein